MNKLYIHPEKECKSCQKVINFCEEAKIEVEIVKDYQDYSKTYPVLVESWSFTNNSDKIIERLKQIKQ